MTPLRTRKPFAWVLLAGTACTPSTPMTAAPVAPFSQGEVDASYEAKGNGVVEVRVKHLGPPNMLEAQATTYVVWITPEGSTVAQNAGAFRVDSNMEATFRFNTSFKKFALAVTPEPAADALRMTGRVVLRADVAAQ